MCYIQITVKAQEKEYKNTLKHFVPPSGGNHTKRQLRIITPYLFDPEISKEYVFISEQKEYTGTLILPVCPRIILPRQITHYDSDQTGNTGIGFYL